MEFINIDEIVAEEMKNPKFAAEYHKLDAEFEQIKRDIRRGVTADPASPHRDIRVRPPRDTRRPAAPPPNA